MKYFITTLGCKVNQYESSALDAMLRERGHEPSDAGSADAYIVNTCAVTAESARKSRQAVRRAQTQNPGAAIAVCGCLSQLDPEDFSDLALVYGSGDRRRFVLDLERAVSEKTRLSHVDDPRLRETFEELPSGNIAGRTRAMLKVEDGCDNFCAYCIVPYVRGPVRSLPPGLAALQAAALQAQGYRELVITGIELASYGRDLEGADLISLIESITEAAPELRLRLGSLEPSVITREFAGRLAHTEKLCRHFHLSLQSGCDEILQNMRRHYDTAAFYRAVEVLRETFEGCAVAADLIVGFPGETEAQHKTTLGFIENCAFSSMHIFPYSPRPGTPAADMDGRLQSSEITARVSEARALADSMEAKFLRGNTGSVLPVLFEADKNGMSVGHADNYALVGVRGAELRGFVRNVKISGVSGRMLIGHIS